MSNELFRVVSRRPLPELGEWEQEYNTDRRPRIYQTLSAARNVKSQLKNRRWSNRDFAIQQTSVNWVDVE